MPTFSQLPIDPFGPSVDTYSRGRASGRRVRAVMLRREFFFRRPGVWVLNCDLRARLLRSTKPKER